MEENYYFDTKNKVNIALIVRDRFKNPIEGKNTERFYSINLIETIGEVIMLMISIIIITLTTPIVILYRIIRPKYFKIGICPQCNKKIFFYSISSVYPVDSSGRSGFKEEESYCRRCNTKFHFSEYTKTSYCDFNIKDCDDENYYEVDTYNRKKEENDIRKRVVSISEVERRDDIIYLSGEETPYTGTIVFYNEDGKIKSEQLYKDGVLNGETRLHFHNGLIEGEITYQNGIPHGKVITYYENGKIESKGLYENGKEIKIDKKKCVGKFLYK